MSLVNYLGTYETLDQVWETYPEGGKEGDYLYIASVLKKWNKYTSAWVDATEEDVEGSTIMSLEEDVVVGSSTLINYLGRFETLENAINTYPEGGNEGDYIYVGDDIYAWDKYANGWFVSSDTPLEVAISEEDIIPDSNTFINYLGGFVDRDAVWHKYPEGGKVGDYLYIASDLHIWDKYICNWVAATPPDESSQIRPIEHLSQEGVVEYSENYINYLGVFESIEQAWEAYPEGGKEGDYIIVGGEQLRWNKYTSNWGEYDPDASTPARPVATIYGDLHVHNDVIIGEDLYARILETFTTKKWVLEQGYISMDDVTSELVMSKIVPDNTTIEVRDGKLVVIGGGGGGTADSVAWDDVTGKPEWIGDTKPTYTLDEIAGSNGDGFVTLLSDQTIEGVKNFAKGAKFNGALLSYDEEKKAWVFPGNIIASGGITAFGSLSTPVASLFEALPIDGTTIKRDPITNELYVDTNVVGGSGGGSLDEEQLEEFLRPYATIEYVSNNYTTKTSVDKALSDKANKATTLAGYGITDAYTKSDINATVDSINTSISNLRKYADDTFVTISTPQRITARHNFIDGLKINGLPIYNSQDDVVYIDANLVVRGGVTAWGTNEETAPNIFEGLPIDGTSIYWDNGVLKSSATSSGGINEEQLADYLTANGYATQDWVTGKGYITSSALEPYAPKTAIPTNTNQLTNGAGFITGITSSMVTSALGYTPLSTGGGTITGEVTISCAANTPLKINSNATDSGIYFNHNGVAKTWVGFEASKGSVLYHSLGSHRLGINNDGVAFYDSNTLLHSGNYSNYALPLTGGTVNGQVTSEGVDNFVAKGSAYSLYFGIGAGQVNRGIYDLTLNKWWIVRGADATTTINASIIAEGLRINQTAFDNGLILNRTAANLGVGIVAMSNDVRLGTFGINGTKTFEIAGDNGIVAQVSTVTGEATFNGMTTIKHSGNTPLVINQTYATNNSRGVVLMNGSMANSHMYYSHLFGKAASSKNSAYVGFYNAGAGSDSNYLSMGLYGVNNVLNILGSGKVVIGGTTASEKLHVYGNILATGGVTATNSSDERLKRNLRKFNASEVLMSLGGIYEYEYIDSEVQKNHIYEGTHYGLIYQHVKGTTLDVMCHEREDGMGALNYIHPKFISLIAGATMENISEVEKLKRKIRHLEAKVKQLEQRA